MLPTNEARDCRSILESCKAASVLLAVFLFAGELATVAATGLKLPALFSENMVLQQGKTVPVWGWADPGQKVTVTLGDQNATATAGADGRWKLSLGPLKAGGPFEMIIAADSTVTIHNVLVGEVWICSGQSNMEMAIGNSSRAWGGVLRATEEIASANFPQIRVFTVKKAAAGQPQQDVEGRWVVASPGTAGEFTAVGFFFGRHLHKVLGVPVGLIHTSWGGTPAESWTSRPALEADSELKPILEGWEKTRAEFPQALEKFRRDLDAWYEAAQNADVEGKPAMDPPRMPSDPLSTSWRPSGLYNAMLAPLIPYGIQGAIWYQGESNASRAYQYRKLFPVMISNWRQAWGEEFPFLFVQLASFRPTSGPEKVWSELREAQLMTLALPKTGMAVAIDIGDPFDIHPKNKQEVGRRLALAAEAIAYGRKIVHSGPIYEMMQVESNKIRLRFKHADGGLIVKGGAALKGFEVAGEDRQFFSAGAVIDGRTVVVQSVKVPRPVAVRYAWADDPLCNLYNGAGLPASPFRTDSWPGVTESPRQ